MSGIDYLADTNGTEGRPFMFRFCRASRVGRGGEGIYNEDDFCFEIGTLSRFPCTFQFLAVK